VSNRDLNLSKHVPIINEPRSTREALYNFVPCRPVLLALRFFSHLALMVHGYDHTHELRELLHYNH
jgi:hypothetical protein